MRRTPRVYFGAFTRRALRDKTLEMTPFNTVGLIARQGNRSIVESVVTLEHFLRQRGVEMIEETPVPRMGATGMGLSIYVRDPDGYIIELKEETPAANR